MPPPLPSRAALPLLLAAVPLLAAAPAVTRAAETAATAAASTSGPNAGQQTRAIKALSPEQIADLRAGRGMGLALAAELNGWPGPLHALQLADRLALTPAQRQRIEALLAAMREETIPLGERVIAAEAALDRLFAERRATPAGLEAAAAAAGAAQATLRAAHLRYHIEAAQVLTPDQAGLYARLRGYGDGPATATAVPSPTPEGTPHSHHH
jgi:Spy/CpxP family protein refolding chaperone